MRQALSRGLLRPHLAWLRSAATDRLCLFSHLHAAHRRRVTLQERCRRLGRQSVWVCFGGRLLLCPCHQGERADRGCGRLPWGAAAGRLLLQHCCRVNWNDDCSGACARHDGPHGTSAVCARGTDAHHQAKEHIGAPGLDSGPRDRMAPLFEPVRQFLSNLQVSHALTLTCTHTRAVACALAASGVPARTSAPSSSASSYSYSRASPSSWMWMHANLRVEHQRSRIAPDIVSLLTRSPRRNAGP